MPGKRVRHKRPKRHKSPAALISRARWPIGRPWGEGIERGKSGKSILIAPGCRLGGPVQYRVNEGVTDHDL